MKQYAIPVAFFLLLSTVHQESAVKQLYPLAGTWKMNAGARSFYENWQIKDAHEMHGKSYRVTGTDTLVLEDVQVVAKQNIVYYIPVVTGQNAGQPVSFQLIRAENLTFTFENVKHDFPQRVVYHLVNNDSLHAWIEGKQNGKDKRSDFYYKRVH